METKLPNAADVIEEIWTQNSKFRRDKSLKLLAKIYKNIKTNPNDAKFRRLNISKIMSKPHIIPQVRTLLFVSGFKPNKNGTHIDLDDTNLNLCVFVSELLQKRILSEENKLEKEREIIKQKTKEKQAKYKQKSNRRKNELMTKIENEKKDILKEKELGFKPIQRKSVLSNNSNVNTSVRKPKKLKPPIHNHGNSSQNNQRSLWMPGSKCQIYFQNSHKWVNAVISQISDNDILTVKYMGFNTKKYERNSPHIRERIKTKSKFVKDPEIMDRWYNLIIQHWWCLSEICQKKDPNINRMIILYALNAYRLILTQDSEYYNNQSRQRQLRYAATNNRDVSMKLNRKKEYERFEREQSYNQLRTAMYKTQKLYNETRLPMPVSGINFAKEYCVLITNKCMKSELKMDYEIVDNGTAIVFTVYADMMGVSDNNMGMPMNMNAYLMRGQRNNMWCVAIPTLFRFERIGIKTVIKRVKKVEVSPNNDRNVSATVPSHGNPMLMNYGNNNDTFGGMESEQEIQSEIIEKIKYINVKSGEILKPEKETNEEELSDENASENVHDFDF